MRLFGSIEGRHGVDEPGYEPELDIAEEVPGIEAQYEINPLGTGLAILGAALLSLSVFLPLDEPNGAFVRVQSNTLIQHEGWWLLILGAVTLIAAAVSYINKWRTWTITVLGLIAAATTIYFATNKGLRTLYPIGSSGEPEPSSSGSIVPLGVAIYIAGAGALLVIIGGWISWGTALLALGEADTRACPDCAETILSRARVCKHCGYRFNDL